MVGAGFKDLKKCEPIPSFQISLKVSSDPTSCQGTANSGLGLA